MRKSQTFVLCLALVASFACGAAAERQAGSPASERAAAERTAAQRAVGQRRGARHDQQIRDAVARLLAGKADYKNVKADVDDATVTLSGNVELDSTRRFLVQRVRRVAHVNGVQNELVLDPPAVEDKTLYGHVQQQLEDAGFKTLTIKAHEGSVTLSGVVRTAQDRERVLRLVRETKGVKEVESRLTVAESSR